MNSIDKYSGMTTRDLRKAADTLRKERSRFDTEVRAMYTEVSRRRRIRDQKAKAAGLPGDASNWYLLFMIPYILFMPIYIVVLLLAAFWPVTLFIVTVLLCIFC